MCVGEKMFSMKLGKSAHVIFHYLLNVAQSNGKLLPVGNYTERTVTQMIDRVAGVHP